LFLHVALCIDRQRPFRASMPAEEDHLGHYKNYGDAIDHDALWFGDDSKLLDIMVVGEGSGNRGGSNDVPCLADHDFTSRLLAEYNEGGDSVPPSLDQLPFVGTLKNYYADPSDSTITTVDSASTALQSYDVRQGVEQDEQRSFTSMPRVQELRFFADDQSFASLTNSSESWPSADDARYGPLPIPNGIAQLSPLPRFVEHRRGNHALKSPPDSELRSAEAPFAALSSAGTLPAGAILSPRAPVEVTVSSNTRLVPEAENSRDEKQNAENPAAGQRIVAHPQDHDVICGRGNATNNHPGNQWYLNRVKEQKTVYDAASKGEKSTIARGVVQLVRTRDPPGRFLNQEEETGKWLDIGDEKAVDKVKAAMRQRGAAVVEQPPQSLQDAPVQVREILPPCDFVSFSNSCHFLRYRCVAGPRKYRRSASTRFPQSERRCVKHETKRVCLLAGIVESSLPLFRCSLSVSTFRPLFLQECRLRTMAIGTFAILQNRKSFATRPFRFSRSDASQNQSMTSGEWVRNLKGESCNLKEVRGKRRQREEPSRSSWVYFAGNRIRKVLKQMHSRRRSQSKLPHHRHRHHHQEEMMM
jgi:hypothetical protein